MNAPINLVLGKLSGHRKTGDGQFQARCPAHDDGTASLSVSEGRDQRVLVNCKAGCDWQDVVRAMELAPTDLFPPKIAERRLVATYDYTDEAGKLLMQVARYHPKDFRQRRPNGNGGWAWSTKDVRQVVYRLPEIRAAIAGARTIYVVEGEKDAEALRAVGLLATCNAAGAGKWRESHTDCLVGAQRVVVIPDRDTAGAAHAAAVATALAGKVADVRVLELPGVGKDAHDWLAAGGTADQLTELAMTSKVVPTDSGTSRNQLTPFEALQKQALIDVAGRAGGGDHGEPRANPAFESAAALLDRDFPKTPWLVQGILVEKAVNAIAGEPKTTKTWAGLEIGMAVATGTRAFGEFQTGAPRQVAVFLVEDDERSTRNRLRALAVGRGVDPREALARIAVKCRGHLNLEDAKDLAWLVASCRSLSTPPELLVLDPLRDLHTGKENDSDAMAPVMGRLRLLRDLLRCAIVFVHHTSKAGETTNARRPGQRMRGSSVVHASVDGGLYLSNLDTDGATRFESTADVELKAVRSAGQFSLCLDVVDDSDGEAIEAKWTVTRPEKPTSASAGPEEVETLVRKALQTEWLFAKGRPMMIGTLQAKVKKRRTDVGAALAQLEAEGKATQILNGKKSAGWVYQPKSDEHRPPDGMCSGSVPGNPEHIGLDAFPPLIGERIREPVLGVSMGSGTHHHAEAEVPELR